MAKVTTPQARAMRWLFNRTGTGLFNRNGVLMAAGELAGVMRSTWNNLIDGGYVERVKPNRLTLTETGHAYCRAHPSLEEASTVHDDDD